MSVLDTPESARDDRRVYVLMGVILLGLFAIVARLWYLQIVHGDALLLASENNRTRRLRAVPERGLIEDAKGRVLATNRPQIVVSVVPDEIRQSREKQYDPLPLLASLLKMPLQKLQETIRENQTGPFEPVRVAVDVDMETATRVEEQRLKLPGVIVGPEPLRHYPNGLPFGHILGQMGQINREDLIERKEAGYRPGDYCGKLGLERAYDTELRGQDGGQRIEVDARGRFRHELENTAPIPGAKLTLTVDAALQKTAYDALYEWAKRGKPGAAVALDPRTGAVLALVSVPSYDPEKFVKGISSADWNALQNDPRKPMINRAVGMATAPGSTFKMIPAAAGLELGFVTPYDGVVCKGVIHLGRWPKRCHKRSGHGFVALNESLAASCDVYYYRLGQRLTPEVMAEWARRFGLGKRTGIDLPFVEARGIVPTPKWKEQSKRGRWVGGDTVDYAIGQSMLGCTPLQMCNVAAAIGNGGTLYRPQLVRSITSFDAENKPVVTRTLQPEVIGKLNLKPSTLSALVRGMESVMERGGTAASSSIPGLRIAGKTGTSQIKRRGEMKLNAWFIGFAPVENPKIAVCVFVEEAGHGGEVAAPIARKIIARYLNLNVPDVQAVPTTD